MVKITVKYTTIEEAIAALELLKATKPVSISTTTKGEDRPQGPPR